MAPKFTNPFTRKKREAQEKERQAIEQQTRALKALQEQSKQVATARQPSRDGTQQSSAVRPGPQQHVPAKASRPPSMLELLSQGQDVLQRLRNMSGSNLEAFPLINLATRQTQQLRDAVQKMAQEEKELWTFQIQELEAEINAQTERIMAGAQAALTPPQENPGYAARSHQPPASRAPATAPPPRAQPDQRPTRSRRTGTYQPPSIPMTPPAQEPVPARSAHTAPRPAAPPPAMAAPPRQPMTPQVVEAAPVQAPVSAPEGAGLTQQTSRKLQLASSLLGLSPTQSANPQSATPQPVNTQTDHTLRPPRQSGDDMFSGLEVKADGSVRGSASTSLTTNTATASVSTATAAAATQQPSQPAPLIPSLPTSPTQQPHTVAPWLAHQRVGYAASAASLSATPSPAPHAAGGGEGHAGAAGRLSVSSSVLAQASSAAGSLGSDTPTQPVGGVSRTASLMSRGLSHSLATRISQSSGLNSVTSGSWSAAMTAAAVAAYAAEAGVTVEDMAVKKEIRKKTKGPKVGYGLAEDEKAQEVSLMIPGQPMPGPQYHAALASQQQQAPQQLPQQPLQQPVAHPQQLQQQGVQQPQPQGRPPADVQLQQLIAQRRAYFMQAAQQQQQAAAAGSAAGSLAAPAAAAAAAAETPTQSSVTEVTAREASFTVKGLTPTKASPVAHTQQGPSTIKAVTSPQKTFFAQQPAQQPQQPVQQPVQPTTGAQGSDQQPPAFQITSSDPLKDLSDYLERLTGPIQTCQHAASVAAAQFVQTLATASKQLVTQQLTAYQQCRGLLDQLSTSQGQVASLESQQSHAVQREDFEEAERLDAQIKALSSQREQVQDTMRQLRTHCGAMEAKQTSLMAMQSEACRVVSAYLTRLHTNHAEVLRQMQTAADQEANASTSAQSAACAAVEDARATLAQRKVDLALALEDIDTRVRTATASLQRERAQAAAQCEALQAEIAQLRAQLAEREAALAAAQAAVRRADEEMQASAAQLLSHQQQLLQQQQQLTVHEQALEARAAQAQSLSQQAVDRRSAQEDQRRALASQGDALREAAQKLQDTAERLGASAEADRVARAAREALQGAADSAEQRLQELTRLLSECEAHVSSHGTRHSQIQSQLLQLQQAIHAATSQLQPLEAAKDAAAARRDYREAARLHAAAKTTAAQLEQLTAQLQQVRAAAADHESTGQAAQAKIASLRAEEPRVRREWAQARHDLLIGSVRARTQRLHAGGLTSEASDLLQQQIALDTDEARQLATQYQLTDTQLTMSSTPLTTNTASHTTLPTTLTTGSQVRVSSTGAGMGAASVAHSMASNGIAGVGVGSGVGSPGGSGGPDARVKGWGGSQSGAERTSAPQVATSAAFAGSAGHGTGMVATGVSSAEGGGDGGTRAGGGAATDVSFHTAVSHDASASPTVADSSTPSTSTPLSSAGPGGSSATLGSAQHAQHAAQDVAQQAQQQWRTNELFDGLEVVSAGVEGEDGGSDLPMRMQDLPVRVNSPDESASEVL